jgi:hypothetical protein
MRVPDEAVEAAKVAMQEVTPPPGVSKADWLKKHGRSALLAGAIEAAAQFIAAQAWDEGFKQGGPMHDVNMDDPDAHTRNPYRSGT